MLSLRALAMAVIGLAGCGVSLSRPYVGLLMLVVMYFFRPDLWGAESVVRPVLWLTVAVGAGWYRQRTQARPSPVLRWLAVLLALYAVSTLAAAISSLQPHASVSHLGDLAVAFLEKAGPLVDIAKIFVAVFLISELCDTPRRLAGVLLAVLAGALWFVKVAVLSWAAAGFSDKVRIDTAVGQGGGANYIAWALATTAPLLVYGLIRGRGWQRLASGVALPLWLAGILATGSRGGIVCLAAGLFALLVITRHFRLVLALALLGLLFVRVAPEGRLDRLQTLTLDPAKMDESMLIRYQHVKAGIQVMGDHPLFGTGLDSFPQSKKKYLPYNYAADDRIVAHNTLIQMGSEAGLIFLAAFVLFNCYALYCLRGSARGAFDDADVELMDWIRAGLAAALAATMVQMLKGDMAKVDYFWWLYGLAITYGMLRKRALEAAAALDAEPCGASSMRAGPPWLRAKLRPEA